MTWNYGVIARTVNNEDVFTLHEFYHNDDGGFSWTEEPITFDADSIKDLEAMLAMALKDAGTARLESGKARAFHDMREES